MSGDLPTLAYWHPSPETPSWVGFAATDFRQAVERLREPLHLVRDAQGLLGLALGGTVQREIPSVHGVIGSLPPLYPEWLGDRSFAETHRVRFPYIAGAMANGIATAELVVAMARAQMLGFFGAGGLDLSAVEAGIARIQTALDDDGQREDTPSWGSNLIHSPHEPELEASVADLYLRRGVRRISASAYMKLTLPLVRLAVSGLRQLPDGRIVRRHHIFAKISRPEVAALFLAPAPKSALDALQRAGQLTADEVRLAAHVPVAADLTAEADSGGHTDNRPLTALLPLIAAQRDAAVREHGYDEPLRVGAAGGLGTPTAVAAAFSLGAAYVLTGSINQGCLEAGLSAPGKALLAQAQLADVVMAPSPDMFELGVKVQVLRRGTLFAQRAQKLYDIYKTHAGLEALAAPLREQLEGDVFRGSLEQIWADTRSFFAKRNPAELARAETDPKHRMALVFRWYVGKASRWAINGEAGRELDYQIWCGPAQGAFNAWVRGSFLEDPAERRVVPVALNLLEGAAVITRAQQLRTAGLAVPAEAFDFRPRPLA